MTYQFVIALIVGFFTTWAGIALYPLANEKVSKENWGKFFRNMLDSFPIVLGIFLMIAATWGSH